MRVKILDRKSLLTISPSASVAQAAYIMREHQVGALPVVEDCLVTGMLTDRDIAIRALALDRPAADTQVREVMTTPAICLPDSASTLEGIRCYQQGHYRRIPL